MMRWVIAAVLLLCPAIAVAGGAGVTAVVTFVGKVIGGATVATAFAAAAFTFIVSKAASMMSKDGSDRAQFGQGRTQTVRQEAAPRQIIYGETRVGGNFTFMRVTDNNRYLHLVITLSGHECNKIGDVYYDDDVIQSDGGDIISKFRGERGSGDVSVVNNRFQTPSPTQAGDIDLTQFKIGTIVNVSGMAISGNNGDHRITDIVIDDVNSVIYMETEDTLLNEAETSATFHSDYVHISKHLGADNQAADTGLVRLISDWTDDHRQFGCAYLYVRVRWSRDKWPTGVPNFSAVVQGKNDIYDPRTDSNGYTANTALCVSDFLTWDRYGFNADYATEINESELIASANVCDESVSLAGGGTETRYTCNGAMSSGSKIAPNLNAMMGSMAGEVIWSGGQWYILAGYYRTPSVTFDESDMTGGLSVITGISRSDLFNSIKGTYVSPDNRYIEAGFPAVTNSTYVTNDGGEKTWENIELPFTDSPSMAQRIAKIQLEQVRQQITVAMPVNLKGLQVKAGDVVNVTNARMGWTDKPFEVTDWELALESADENPIFGVNLELRETASGVYDWNSGEETEVDLAPDTDLPDASSVTAPTNLTVASGTDQLYRKKDGTVVTRTRMDWTASVDSFVQEYEVQYKRSSDSEWQAGGKPEGEDTHWYIWDVEDGEDYDHRIRALNPFGPRSDWVTDTNHTVIGKTAPPEDVANLAATTANWISGGSKQYGIHLTWDDVSDADLGRYEVRTDTNFGTASGRLARPKDNQVQLPIATAQSYTFYVKAVDTSGNYSTNATSVSITIEAPGQPTLSQRFKSDEFIQSWTEDTTDFPVAYYDIRRQYGSLSGDLVVEGSTNTISADQNAADPVDLSGFDNTHTTQIITSGFPDAGNNGTFDIDSVSIGASVHEIVVTQSLTDDAGDATVDHVDTFAEAERIDTIQSRELRFIADWLGTRTWYVAEIDVAGNQGAPGSADASISAPPKPANLRSKVINFDVLLNWDAVKGTLPVDHYNVYRDDNANASFGDATNELNTTSDGTFASIKEDTEGEFAYFVTAEDTAGNEGPVASLTAYAEEPNDFVVQSTFNSDFTAGTRTDLVLVEPGTNTLLGPFDSTETWESHFIGTGTSGDPEFATPQEQIDAGFPYYLQPGTVSEGMYQEEFDVGVVLNTTTISVTYGFTKIQGDPSVSTQIEVRESPSDPWRSFTGRALLANNVRYIRVTLTVNGPDREDLGEIKNLTVKAKIKKVTEEGVATANAGDSDSPLGGTKVTMDTTFLDVRAVNANVKGDNQGFEAFADWEDVQGQNEFHVWVYDSDGNRATKDITYIARGLVN